CSSLRPTSGRPFGAFDFDTPYYAYNASFQPVRFPEIRLLELYMCLSCHKPSVTPDARHMTVPARNNKGVVISFISFIPSIFFLNRVSSMLAISTKFSVISSLVVIALQLPHLAKRLGVWGRREDIDLEPSDDSNKIATLKSQVKAAQEEVKVSIGLLKALTRVPSDASHDERRLWMERLSLVMKETTREIDGMVLEVEPFDLKLRWKGRLLAMETALLLAYGEFTTDLNALAIVFSELGYLDKRSTLHLQIAVKVAISRIQKIITSVENATSQAKADLNMRIQEKEIDLA
ncbi:hypothetical protein M413DRAFT_13864, partial [Hebeloma cylindrosporum]